MTEETNLLAIIDAHNNVMTIRKAVCNTLRSGKFEQYEIAGLLIAENTAVAELSRLLLENVK